MKRTTRRCFRICERNGKDGEVSSAFEFRSPEAMLDFDDPASDAALIKACVELVGVRDFSKTVRM